MKRLYDIVLSVAGLLVLSPVFVVIAILIKAGDRGPVLFKQQRVGRNGRLFWIWKFRSMITGAPKLGAAVTVGGDSRITHIGQLLRRYKLDELPQLVNVLRGDMSLVGPRPEVPRYVAMYTIGQLKVLRYRPGITDLATLEFRNEEELLRKADDLERFYVDYCIPRKIELNLQYIAKANLWSDTLIIVRTVLPAFDRQARKNAA